MFLLLWNLVIPIMTFIIAHMIYNNVVRERKQQILNIRIWLIWVGFSIGNPVFSKFSVILSGFKIMVNSSWKIPTFLYGFGDRLRFSIALWGSSSNVSKVLQKFNFIYTVFNFKQFEDFDKLWIWKLSGSRWMHSAMTDSSFSHALL